MRLVALLLLLAIVTLSAGQRSRGSARWGLKLGHPVAETKSRAKPDQQEELVQEELFRVAPRRAKAPATKTPAKQHESSENEGSGDNSHSSESIEEASKESERWNRNAFYHFQSVVKDGIKDGQVERHETRKGLKVTGSYSYTDGYVQRTVQYEADDKGYRIIKDAVTKIGDGPKENEQGIASVETEAFGQKNAYSVSGQELNDWRLGHAKNSHLKNS